MIEGKSYRFGAYKAQAKGNGKLAAGADYYYFHRVEPMEAASSQGSSDFNPAELEA